MLVIAVSRMNHQPRLLVDNQYIVILIDDRERYIFGRDGSVYRLMV